MELSGSSMMQENVNNSKRLLDYTFTDDSSTNNIIYFWSLGKKTYDNEVPIKIRLYERTFSNVDGNKMSFQTLIDTPVIVGDILYDYKNSLYLLCNKSFNIDDIHYQGELLECNWVLKWQNKEGKILEYPCVDINTTQYNSGETSSRQFTLGTTQHRVSLPYDENTVVLDTPQRFYLDYNKQNPTSFIVTQNDTTTNKFGKKGIVKVTLAEYQNDSDTDRPDLGICDYFETDKAEENKKAVIIYEDNIIKSGGDSKIFTAKFYDDNGNELNNVIPIWKIVSDFKEELYVKEHDNQIAIGVDNDNYVDEDIKLILSSENNNIPLTSLVIHIKSLL